MRSISLRDTARLLLLSVQRHFVVTALCAALVYSILVFLLHANLPLITELLIGEIALHTKLQFLSALLFDATIFGGIVSAILLGVAATLFGVAIALLSELSQRHLPSASVPVGISGLCTISTLLGGGCGSCGMLIVGAIASVNGGVLTLPFGGLEFTLGGIVLLLVSVVHLLWQIARQVLYPRPHHLSLHHCT